MQELKGLNCLCNHINLNISSVDIQDKSWNQIEEYILKWYPVLQNSHILATK